MKSKDATSIKFKFKTKKKEKNWPSLLILKLHGYGKAFKWNSEALSKTSQTYKAELLQK